MSISMYQASAPRFANTLKNLSAILDKAKAHAAARKIDEQVLTNGREAIGQLLEPTMRDLFAAPLQAKMNEKADLVMARLFSAQYWNAGTKTFNQPITKVLLESILEPSKRIDPKYVTIHDVRLWS